MGKGPKYKAFIMDQDGRAVSASDIKVFNENRHDGAPVIGTCGRHGSVSAHGPGRGSVPGCIPTLERGNDSRALEPVNGN